MKRTRDHDESESVSAWERKITLNWRALSWAPPCIRANRELVLHAVEHDGQAIAWACDALKADEEIVTIAVSNDPLAIWDVSKASNALMRVTLTWYG